MMRRCLGAAMVAGLSLVVGCSTAAQAKDSTPAGITVVTLAQAPVQELPAGKVFVGILNYRQVPGAACGPACGLDGFVYTLHGVATISLPGGAVRSVGPGSAAFTPALAGHTNDRVVGRVGAGAIAIGLIVVVILLCAATWLRGGLRRAIIPLLSLLLIAGGALVLSGGTSNEWYFVAVRSDSEFNTPMPDPDGRVAFASQDVDPVPAAPYIETLSAITVPPGGRYDAPQVNGPQTIMVLEGTAAVHVDNETLQLGSGHGSLAQAGKSLAIANPGSDTLQVLDFAVTPLSGSS
jgi:hypothetical protein